MSGKVFKECPTRGHILASAIFRPGYSWRPAVHTTTREEAREALSAVFDQRVFGAAGDLLVIEENLVGTEASLLVVTDGSRYVTLAAAQDFKRIGDGDTGKNTGGMGAIAPAVTMTSEIFREIESSIIAPTLLGMAEEGRAYVQAFFERLEGEW